MVSGSLAWPLSNVMEDSWDDKGVWFWHSLTSVDGAYWMVIHYLSPYFSLRMSTDVDKSLSKLWATNAQDTVDSKVREFKTYAEDVKMLFL